MGYAILTRLTIVPMSSVGLLYISYLFMLSLTFNHTASGGPLSTHIIYEGFNV